SDVCSSDLIESLEVGSFCTGFRQADLKLLHAVERGACRQKNQNDQQDIDEGNQIDVGFIVPGFTSEIHGAATSNGRVRSFSSASTRFRIPAWRSIWCR